MFDWITTLYDPTEGTWGPACPDFKWDAEVRLYDGCGNLIETWIYENAYPQTVEFGELDMVSTDLVTVDMTLRYDRAYIQ